MYLKRLEMLGFKSFAVRTVLEFSTGITAVVGPNGAGKSNVADAVRWVLGEQSMRQLRGKKSEDIIFVGGHGKSALGMAGSPFRKRKQVPSRGPALPGRSRLRSD